MAILVDTSILARLVNVADPAYLVATEAVMKLHRRGELLHITSQNLVEFRNVATRPKTINGLELTSTEAEAKAAVFESTFPILLENSDIYPAWKALVAALSIVGKQVHDARLVAVCHVHAVTHLLTFNASHFTRMSKYGPGIIVLEPTAVCQDTV